MAKNNILSLGFLVLTIVISVNTQSCLKSKRPGLPPKVVEVLNNSGIHKPKINKFILRNMQSKDSLKLDAAYFIIENLNRNYSAFYKLTDSLENEYELNPEDFKDLYSLRLFTDSLQTAHGELTYSADSFSIDYSGASFNLLYENLQLAFETRNRFNYDFDIFKKYVLPFRVANERIEKFRENLSCKLFPLWEENKSLEYNIQKINTEINSLVEYDNRYIKNHSTQTVTELLHNRKGNLEDINILKIKVFRSLGIAAVMDFTPALVDSSGLYLWTSIILPNGKEINLDITNGNLKSLLKNSINKVYRRTYFEDTTSLFAIKNTKENTPPFLGHFNNFDISEKYLTTFNTSVVKIDTNKYFYLAAFNDGKWKPIAWSMNNNGIAHFKNIGQNGFLLPVVWEKDRIRCIGAPFKFTEEKIEFSDNGKSEEVYFNFSSKGEKINQENQYTLYYWENNWKRLNSKLTSDGRLYSKVPQNVIFLISDGDGLFDERIFVIEDGQQKFY
jgi:hypothetical protein